MISHSKDTSPLFVPPPSIIFANCAKSALLLIAILLLSLPTLLSLRNLTIVTPSSMVYLIFFFTPLISSKCACKSSCPYRSPFPSHFSYSSFLALASYSPTHYIQNCFYHFQNTTE